MSVLAACMCTTCMQCPKRSEEVVKSPGNGVTYNCEVPCEC